MTVEFADAGDFDENGEPLVSLPKVWQAVELEDAKPMEWLARHRIPRSAVSILVGDEGIGKSLLWVWIIAAVTTGKPLPEFEIPSRGPGVVVLVLTEDEWSYTVRPRLDVAGADLDMVRVICTEADGSGSPVFPRDMDLLTKMDVPPALVVVDAFADTVPGSLSLKDPQQARKALHPWKEAATVTGAAVLLLTHTNRMDSKSARDKYGLTGELRKKARMTLYAQEDEDGALVVGPEKSNLVGRVKASRFTIAPMQVFEATDDSDGTVPLLRYAGEAEMTAGEYIAEKFDADHGEDADDRTEAEVWLEDYLTDQGGTVGSADAKRKAKAFGISERTLKRAAKKLGLVIEQSGFPRTTTWSVPQSGHSEAHVSESGPTGLTGSDLHKHVGPTGTQSGQSGQSGHPKSNGPTAGPTVQTEAVTS